jgi:hypothetical protein
MTIGIGNNKMVKEEVIKIKKRFRRKLRKLKPLLT